VGIICAMIANYRILFFIFISQEILEIMDVLIMFIVFFSWSCLSLSPKIFCRSLLDQRILPCKRIH
jgi:Mg/Co/Ni transporter MgtE